MLSSSSKFTLCIIEALQTFSIPFLAKHLRQIFLGKPEIGVNLLALLFLPVVSHAFLYSLKTGRNVYVHHCTWILEQDQWDLWQHCSILEKLPELSQPEAVRIQLAGQSY